MKEKQRIKAVFLVAVLGLGLIIASCSQNSSGEGVIEGPSFSVEPGTKRGVAYGFYRVMDWSMGQDAWQQQIPVTTESDMDNLSPGIHWWYNWAAAPEASVVGSAARDRNLPFVPMAWSTNWNENNIKTYTQSNPDVDYLLAYNEPNLADQANKTPAQAAADWPRLATFARQNNLKLVSPAMNWGTLSGYSNPWLWLDEFYGFGKPGFPGVSLNDIAAISIHCYMNYPTAVKGFIAQFKKYNKPIWLTEFCAWENNPLPSVEWQMKYMSEIVVYMELDPFVERYAWFIPKGKEQNGDASNNNPNNKLLTHQNPSTLTDLGYVYVNITTCDQSVWVPAGETILAKDFANCHLSEYVNDTNSWPSGGPNNTGASVHFRPSTDGGILDVYNFTANKWLEYQINTATAKQYTLTLRYSAAQDTPMTVSVDDAQAAATTLNATNTWTTSQAIDLGSLSAGNHKIRLRVSGGNGALNWLKVE